MAEVKFKFNAEDYYYAALERRNEAQHLYVKEHYSLSIYVTGLSIECLLRAFKYKKDKTFDERHDIKVLLKFSGFSEEINDHDIQIEIHTAINTVYAIWRNNLRFMSKNKMKKYLKDIGRDKGFYKNFPKSADTLKCNSRKLLDASYKIFNRGVSIWEKKFLKKK